jgi:hypothetical protein
VVMLAVDTVLAVEEMAQLGHALVHTNPSPSATAPEA